jgi:hypothetical protein
MKLRLRENSIRLRLLQTEARQLRETGKVSETIIFGSNAEEKLIYSLRVSEDKNEISARIKGSKIEIFLPLDMAISWIDSDETGLYADQKTGGSTNLKIIVEKDFVCVERPLDTDNKDAFPHPKMNC